VVQLLYRLGATWGSSSASGGGGNRYFGQRFSSQQSCYIGCAPANCIRCCLVHLPDNTSHLQQAAQHAEHLQLCRATRACRTEVTQKC
jgi:hypothetical protein